MSKRSLRVVPEPKEGTRTVMRLKKGSEDNAFFIGKGEVDLVCGACYHVLCSKMDRIQQFENIVFQCSKCGSFNDPQ